MPNRLANETSPYLLQHAENPVDWYPWGPEALARAKAEDKPILLSIGYSACHWCHVMEHESFEDADVARHMNEGFVNVKVDREERPDLDELYMRAVQAFTGRGGWPMTVFLTPDGKPFFGGTYFPPKPAHGMPSFRQVLDHVRNLWQNDRARVADVTGKVGGYLTSAGRLPKAEGALSDDWLDRLAHALDDEFDPVHKGFGGAPKFPPHGSLAALLAHWRRSGSERSRTMALETLEAMAQGGMYDLAGGGFARYSVDAEWRIPHFEKMLYDNAQLAPIYTDAWKITKDPFHARVVRETLGWILREMTSPEGGFRSSLDADSEGVEGKFYVWTPAEIRNVVGVMEGMKVSALLGVTDEGNFELEGHGVAQKTRASVLRMEVPRERFGDTEREMLDHALQKLREAREQRVRPGRDDKIITSWNALAISAFAQAGATFDVPEWRGAVSRACRFLLDNLRVKGRLQRTWKDGRAHIPAFADDHAFLVNALIDLYEATFDFDWLAEANALADTTIQLFWDEQEGGLFYTGTDAEVLLARSKHLLGGAEPSANGVAALAFARLAELCGRDDLGEKAERILRAYQPLLDRAPRALGVEAIAAGWRTGGTQQIGVVGGAAEHLLNEVRGRYLPFAVLAWNPSDQTPPLLPWMEGKTAIGGKATAFLCERMTCKAPTQDPAELAPIPPGGTERAAALRVVGHSMRGVADDGALIYFEDQRTPPTPDMLGH
ncbi:MAG: thioredoxin domain-containing protein, partial [Myxococcota bacterium]